MQLTSLLSLPLCGLPVLKSVENHGSCRDYVCVYVCVCVFALACNQWQALHAGCLASRASAAASLAGRALLPPLCSTLSLTWMLCACVRVQERVRELEEQALAEKEWHLRGEVAAMHRPLNSALEVDVDFDTTGARGGVGRRLHGCCGPPDVVCLACCG